MNGSSIHHITFALGRVSLHLCPEWVGNGLPRLNGAVGSRELNGRLALSVALKSQLTSVTGGGLVQKTSPFTHLNACPMPRIKVNSKSAKLL